MLEPPAGEPTVIHQLRVRGPFRGTSGHDRHTRAFVRALIALGVEVALEQPEDWRQTLPPDPELERLVRPLAAPPNENATTSPPRRARIQWTGRANAVSPDPQRMDLRNGIFPSH